MVVGQQRGSTHAMIDPQCDPPSLRFPSVPPFSFNPSVFMQSLRFIIIIPNTTPPFWYILASSGPAISLRALNRLADLDKQLIERFMDNIPYLLYRLF